jgi:hypothetical protein
MTEQKFLKNHLSEAGKRQRRDAIKTHTRADQEKRSQGRKARWESPLNKARLSYSHL